MTLIFLKRTVYPLLLLADTDLCLPKIAAEGVDRSPAEVDLGEGLLAILGLPPLGKVFLECLAVLVCLRGLNERRGEALMESRLG